MKKIKKLKLILGLSFATVLLCLVFAFSTNNDFKISKNLDIFISLFREINMYYVDNTDPEKLIKESINGMLSSLDPYTDFIPEEDVKDFEFQTTGKYGGIGALIRRIGENTIIAEPYEGFPAQKAGLKAGDIILKVNDTDVKGKKLNEVSEMLKGNPNTECTVYILRPGLDKPFYVKIMRENITVKNIPYYGMLNDNTAYIKLTGFTKGAGEEVRNSLIKLKEKHHPSALILDLRDNPGGLLQEAVNVANVFVKQNQLIVYTQGKIKELNQKYRTNNEPVDTTIKLIVLVNRGSASASEIVAGSLQDLDRAIIVGQRTFGKGLVQSVKDLSYNTKVKITTAKYYIPSGRCIQALDYSHRNEDGSVNYIPDSLISEYKTLHGRKVYDGAGIAPDILVIPDQLSNITIKIYNENLIFDYATLFTSKVKNIPPIEKFVISDSIYNDFVKFCMKKDFNYTSKTQEKLKELIEIAKKEKYYEAARTTFDQLQKELAQDKEKDLYTCKKEISSYLLTEIACRYYYQTGKVKASLVDDIQLKKALEIIGDSDNFIEILTKHDTEKSIDLKR
jgi:carboxyl-terminal processing protease